AWKAVGRIPRWAHRPLACVPRPELPRRLSNQGAGSRLRWRSPLIQTPLQVREIQYLREAFHLREGVIKMRTYPQPTAVRAINAQRNDNIILRQRVGQLLSCNATRAKS